MEDDASTKTKTTDDKYMIGANFFAFTIFDF